MADDLNHLVVAPLTRYTRAVAGHLREEHDRRFDPIDKRLDGSQYIFEPDPGPGTMNRLKVRQLEARHDASGAWRRRINKRLDQI
jgi:hypothetical protein